MQGTLDATLAAQLAAAQSALAGTTNSLNATINQLTASVAADEANIAALTTQLTQVIALYHLLLPPHPVGHDLALTPYPAPPAVREICSAI